MNLKESTIWSLEWQKSNIQEDKVIKMVFKLCIYREENKNPSEKYINKIGRVMIF